MFWSAYLIVAILILNLLAISVAIYYIYSHASILKEEPGRLLNHAILLEKNPLLEVPQASRQLVKDVEGMGSRKSENRIKETKAEQDKALLETVAKQFWVVVAKRNCRGWVIARLK